MDWDFIEKIKKVAKNPRKHRALIKQARISNGRFLKVDGQTLQKVLQIIYLYYYYNYVYI